MAKQAKREFQKALQDYTFDAAAGRAIRHLCDLGLSAEQIKSRLDFPVTIERIRTEKRIYDEEKAAIERGEGTSYSYIREYGKYGKSYLRKVPDEHRG